jgi:arylsulfatase A-like enzyme
VIEPGTVINDIGAHEDMLPTLLAAAGDPRQGGPAEGQAVGT